MEDDEDDGPNPVEVIRDAFIALEGSHPELIPNIAAALKSSGSEDFSAVEAAFREAAVALVPTDKDAAETLFTFAEILAQDTSLPTKMMAQQEGLIQEPHCGRTGCTPTFHTLRQSSMEPPRPLFILVTLAYHGGQYMLIAENVT